MHRNLYLNIINQTCSNSKFVTSKTLRHSIGKAFLNRVLMGQEIIPRISVIISNKKLLPSKGNN